MSEQADSVYVSYSWTAEADSSVVDQLEKACQKRGIELQRDKNRVGYGESIGAYMNELAAGRCIVLVLSKPYFESPYCMYELREIYDKQPDFRKRVFPIVLSGTCFSKPLDRIPYLKHWEEEKEKLKSGLSSVDREYTKSLNQELDDYADFRRLIDELLNILSDMNALTEDIHIDTDFEALLNRIKPVQPRQGIAIAQRFREPDNKFQQIIRSEIKDILEQRRNLSDALRDESRAVLSGQSVDLAGFLCQTDLGVAIDDVLRPATEKCLSVLGKNSPEFDDTWEAAKSVLALLSLFSVSPDWVEQQEKKFGTSDFALEMVVNTPGGVEVASARYRQIAPKLDAKRGQPDIFGSDAIPFPKLESGWSDDHALDRLLVEIWTRVFPEATRHVLSDKDLRKLNAALARHERHHDRHYYIPIDHEEENPLLRRDFYEKLMGKLPTITIIYIKNSGGTPALLVTDEIVFMDSILGFLDIRNSIMHK
ncbi:MAG: toll/interleukin-1 receptor domain-containing protein [Pseudomonadota bacterium]